MLNPAVFALHIALHFVTKYDHLNKSFVELQQFKWSRIPVGGKDHKHSFVRDGDEKLIVKVEVDATAGKDKITGKVTGGMKDLLGGLFRAKRGVAAMGADSAWMIVLKSSGSAFEDFYVDEYTTLSREYILPTGTHRTSNVKTPYSRHGPNPVDGHRQRVHICAGQRTPDDRGTSGPRQSSQIPRSRKERQDDHP